jgi:hypothetical protein
VAIGTNVSVPLLPDWLQMQRRQPMAAAGPPSGEPRRLRTLLLPFLWMAAKRGAPRTKRLGPLFAAFYWTLKPSPLFWSVIELSWGLKNGVSPIFFSNAWPNLLPIGHLATHFHIDIRHANLPWPGLAWWSRDHGIDHLSWPSKSST